MKTDIDDKMNIKNDMFGDDFAELSDDQIKSLLETDIEDLDIEHDFDQEMKFLSQDKIKKLMAELGDLFHMAEDSRVIIEDYDEYMALLKDYLRQVDDLHTALKKYPKLASLIAILMSLTKRIEQAQILASKKESEKVNISQKNESEKLKSHVNLQQNKKNIQEQNKINQSFSNEVKSNTNINYRNPRAIKGMVGDKNVAFTDINYMDNKKKSRDFEFATLDKNGNLIFDKIGKKPQNKPTNKIQKPTVREKKNAPKVEKVFTQKPEEKLKTQKVSPSQEQKLLDAYNKDVASRARSSSGPNQMTR